MRIVTNALVRALVVGLLPSLLFAVLDARINEEGGANIGGGMLVLAVTLFGSLVWAVRDARQGGDHPTPLTWVLAAVMTFVLQAVEGVADAGIPADSESWSGLATSGLLSAVLVLVGGSVGAVVGRSQHHA